MSLISLYRGASTQDIDVPFNTEYTSKGYSYFDVWAPEIATHYGEVFWTDQGVQPLPADLIKKFDGKVIAIQGYEQDQVMVQPVGKPGANPEKDVSVPINWAYNHHYCAYMGTKHSEYKMVKTATRGDVYGSGAHGKEFMVVAEDKPDQSGRKFADVAQTSWFISEGNGGESRKSFHGYPQGFAQLLESPTTWHITPMQIDTRNRDHGVGPESVRNCTNMTLCAGYEPRQARYGKGWGGVTAPNKNPGSYSGILECPCNGRYGGDEIFYPKSGTRKIIHAVTAIPAGSCSSAAGHPAFASAKECYDAVAKLGFNASLTATLVNQTVNDATAVAGCSLQTTATTAAAVFNAAAAATKGCTQAEVVGAMSASPVSGVTFSITLTLAKTAVEAFTSTPTTTTAAAAPEGTARITLTGPSDAWFAVGLDAKEMADSPYAIVVNATAVSEYKIGTCGTEAQHCVTDVLASSLTLVSNTVDAKSKTRTVVVTRGFVGATKDHYSFDPSKVATMPYISAQGMGMALAYHGPTHHDSLTLSFASVETAATTCVCDLGLVGELCDTPGRAGGAGKCATFTKDCVPRRYAMQCDVTTLLHHLFVTFTQDCVPRTRSPTLGAKGETSGDLFAQANPTCNSLQVL